MKYVPGAPPPDPEKYVLVKARSGWHWRKKRGLNNPTVKVNDALEEQNLLAKISGPAAVRVRGALSGFLEGLNCGTLTVQISAAIRKGLTKGTWPDYAPLKKIDFQPRHPFGNVMQHLPYVLIEDGHAVVSIAINPGVTITQLSPLITSYKYTLVMVAGDAVMEDFLLTFSMESRTYGIGERGDNCVLRLALPEKGVPWLVGFRLTSFEKTGVAPHPRHAGFRVLAAGK